MCRVAGLLSIIYISRHKSNALARELGQVLREARAEPLSAAQMDSVLEVAYPTLCERIRFMRRLSGPCLVRLKTIQWSAWPVDRSNR